MKKSFSGSSWTKVPSFNDFSSFCGWRGIKTETKKGFFHIS